jgi:hypothetical protein
MEDYMEKVLINSTTATTESSSVAVPAKSVEVKVMPAGEVPATSDTTVVSDTVSEEVTIDEATTGTEDTAVSEGEVGTAETVVSEETAVTDEAVVDEAAVTDQVIMDEAAVKEGEVILDDGGYIDPGYQEGTLDPTMNMGAVEVKEPLLSSWIFVIGISAAVLFVSVALGAFLARRKIKKGIELYED